MNLECLACGKWLIEGSQKAVGAAVQLEAIPPASSNEELTKVPCCVSHVKGIGSDW